MRYIMSSSEHDYSFKLRLAGDSGVGKSCLLLRFAEDTYTESYVSTIGVDFRIKSIPIGDKTAKLQIWDCAGQERFRTIPEENYRGVRGIVLAFDLTDRVSFNNLEKNLDEAKRSARSESTPEIILVGTKSDLVGKRPIIPDEEIKEWANSRGYQYIETSAKNNLNVEKVFSQIAAQIAQKEDLLKQQKGNEKEPLLPCNGASHWSAGPGFLASPSTKDKDANNEENSCLKRMCAIL